MVGLLTFNDLQTDTTDDQGRNGMFYKNARVKKLLITATIKETPQFRTRPVGHKRVNCLNFAVRDLEQNIVSVKCKC